MTTKPNDAKTAEAAKPCRECSECDGNHHWLESCPEPSDDDDPEGEQQHSTPGYE